MVHFGWFLGWAVTRYGERIIFPRRPNATQVKVCHAVRHSMLHGHTASVSARTGAGKSDAFLVPALQLIRAQGGHRVLLCAPHVVAQQYQWFKDVKRLDPQMRVALVAGRKHICHLGNVRDRGGSGADLECENLRTCGRCQHHETGGGRSFVPLSKDDSISDIEDLMAKAERQRSCVYYGAREAIKAAELAGAPIVVIVSHTTALSPVMRSSHGITLGAGCFLHCTVMQQKRVKDHDEEV